MELPFAAKKLFRCLNTKFRSFLMAFNCKKLTITSVIGSLSSDVFERRTSTGSGRFALLSHDFEQIFGQIVSIRIKTLGNKNTVASRLIKREKGLLPVDVRRSKTSLLKLPIIVSTQTFAVFKCR